jgi:hypothetical protein
MAGMMRTDEDVCLKITFFSKVLSLLCVLKSNLPMKRKEWQETPLSRALSSDDLRHDRQVSLVQYSFGSNG